MVGRTTLRLLLFRAEVMVVICKLADGGARPEWQAQSRLAGAGSPPADSNPTDNDS